MKKVLVLLAMVLSFANDILAEITVKTEILDANSQPPIVGGVISGESNYKVIRRGIVVSTGEDILMYSPSIEISNPHFYEDKTKEVNTPATWNISDYRIIDCTDIGIEQFWCTLPLLKENMTYFFRAFVILDNNDIVYGDTKELMSQSYNRHKGRFDDANVFHYERTLFDLISDEIINTNDGFYSFLDSSPTIVSYKNNNGYYYKTKTEWNYKLWYYHSEHCIQNKIVSIPIMTYSNNRLYIEKNAKDNNKDITIYYSINGNYFRPEHFTDIYTKPIEINSPSAIYCYAISSDGYISYTNIYVINNDNHNGDDSTQLNFVSINKHGKTDSYSHNMSGQRVETPSKGIYIKNGKKVIIK